LINNFKYRILKYYCIIFYALMFYKFFNGMLLFQLQPSFFYTREDVFTWLFMQTGLHQWLLNNQQGCLLFDFLFYAAPFLFLLHNKFNRSTSWVAAIVMLVINWCYVQCYTLYPSNSIEAHVAWLLFPAAFIPNNPKTFELLYRSLRYFFLFFFVSAGVWKFVQGGIFNFSQMSGILLLQHKEMLINSPGYWQTQLIGWLIQHQTISYSLYLIVTILELGFIIGFFTIRFDKALLILFIVFLVTDHLIMRIPYYDLAPFLLSLCFRSPSQNTFN
jgi:hypothetical protein